MTNPPDQPTPGDPLEKGPPAPPTAAPPPSKAPGEAPRLARLRPPAVEPPAGARAVGRASAAARAAGRGAARARAGCAGPAARLRSAARAPSRSRTHSRRRASRGSPSPRWCSGSSRSWAVSCAGLLGIPVGIAGIVCGYIGRNQARERGLPTSMATAGLICAIIGTILGILFAILVGADHHLERLVGA